MIQSNFHGFKGAKSVRASGHHSDFVVQTLDGPAGDFAFGLEPVEQQGLVRPEHPGHFAHRLNPAAQGPFGPHLEEHPRPRDGFIIPEVLEGILEDPRAGGGQLAGHQCVEL